MSEFPYPGLRPFKREETDIFFGRDELSNQLIDRLGQTHFLAVVGMSGCGKSSLVKTGLLSGLERGLLAKAGLYWRVAELRPGDSPFTHLAAALLADTVIGEAYTQYFEKNTNAVALLEAHLKRGPLSLHEVLQTCRLPEETNLLILVDQFEELFRYYQKDGGDDSAAFVKLLLNAAARHPQIYVVLTMRSDFIGDCALFAGLPEAINRGLFLTPRLNRDQLLTVIEGPAKVFGGQVDAELSNHLLNEMGNDPDQLPVLQHVLMRMWQLVADKPHPELSKDHYYHIGGLANALDRHAEEAYQELASDQGAAIEEILSPNKAQIAETLFRRLCEREPRHHRDTRSPASLAEVAELADVSWSQVLAVVEQFRTAGRHFLVLSGVGEVNRDSIVDITHESLIQYWRRLRQWTEAEAAAANEYRRIEERAYLWQNDQADLLAGKEFEPAIEWWTTHQPGLAWARRYAKDDGQHFPLAERFIRESQNEHRRQQEALEAARKQQEQEQEAARQRKLKQARYLALAAGVALIIMGGFAGWALWERDKTQAAWQVAEQKEKERTQTLFESQLMQATLLNGQEDYAVSQNILKRTLTLDEEIAPSRRHARNFVQWYNQLMGSQAEHIYPAAGKPLLSVALNNDGSRIAAGGEHGTLVLFDREGQILQRFQGHTGHVKAVAFHPNGEWLLSAGNDREIIFWSLREGEKVKILPTGEEEVDALAVSPTGNYLAGGGKGKNIRLWNLQSGQVIRTLSDHNGRIADLAFDPTGTLLASAAYDNTVKLWQVASGELVRTLEGHTDHVNRVAFSPDGLRLASGGKDNKVRLWNRSGELLRELSGHRDTVFGLYFTATGRLVSAGRDATLRVWDTRYGIILRILYGQSKIAALAGVGAQVFSVDNHGHLARWSLALPHQYRLALPQEPSAVAISPAGDSIAVGFTNGTLQLRTLTTQNVLWNEEKAHRKRVQNLAFNTSGTLLASAGSDNQAKLWQATVSGLDLLKTIEHRDAVNSVVFAPDGQTLASAGFDGRIVLSTPGQSAAQTFPSTALTAINALDFDPTGNRLLATTDEILYLWDMQDTTKPIQTYTDFSSGPIAWSILAQGQDIISVGYDQQVYVHTQGQWHSLTGHRNTIFRAILSPDGRQVMTASADATIRLWDLDKRKELFALRLPVNSGRPIAFWSFDFRCTAQNCWIAVPLTSGELLLYDLGPQDRYVK